LKKILLPGLTVYGVIAGAGLFLGSGLSSPYLFPWIAGYLFLAFIIAHSTLLAKERLTAFPIIVMGIIQLNFLIQISGGAHSSLWPLYFLFAVLVAAFSPPRRTYATLGLILVIESSGLFLRAQWDPGNWTVYAGFALSLVGVSIAISHIMHRTRREADRYKDAHERLLAHANAVDPLAGRAKLEMLTAEARQASNVHAAMQREDAFAGLIDMIYEFVPAHTYALYLKETTADGAVFALRAKRSLAAGRALAPIGTLLDPRNNLDVINGCARDGRPRSLSIREHLPGNLGYYAAPVPVKSVLAIPIVQKEETVGVLVVDSLEVGAFSLETQDLVARFAPFFIQIIEKIRLSQELDLRARNFEGLLRISSVLSSSLDLADILDRLSAELKVLVPYDFCLFVRHDEKNRDMIVAHQSGPVSLARKTPSLFDKITMPSAGNGPGGIDQELRFPIVTSTIISQMLKRWESGTVAAYHFHDLGERGRDIVLFDASLELTRQLRSLSCWPLVAGDKFIGAFSLGSVRADAFSEYHRYVLDTLMNQVAVVMDNILLHEQVRSMAHTDGLTGLLNHRTFMDKLDEEFRRLDRDEEKEFSLLLLDIDFFKKVNDEHGHPVGDVALRTIAGIIREMARGIDFVARYGGEEFAVGMVGAGINGAQKMAERIRKAVEHAAIPAGKIVLKRTLSIGVASYFRGCAKKETLIDRADQALYRAKHEGRNRVCLYSGRGDTAVRVALTPGKR
jgi:two-component system cell cycle response regulator